MSIQETQKMFQMYTNTGTIEYSCLSELFLLAPALPDEDEAKIIATQFLKDNNLWHEDLVCAGVVTGGTSGGQISHLLVRFNRSIEGLPLTGPGNKIAVRIGNNGKVIRMLYRYPEIEYDQDEYCIEPEEAISRIQRGDAIYAVSDECENIHVNQVYLGYYLEPINEKQSYLKPYYVVEGDCYNKQGEKIEDFVGWVKATK